jgi:hypothetical protein
MNYSYQKEFQEALQITEKLGFFIPTWKFKERLLYSNNSIKKVSDTLNYFLINHEMCYEDLASQCIFIHNGTFELVAREIDCNSIVTIGWFYDETIHESMYEFTEEEFKNFTIKKPGISKGFDAHVWITLDSGEIIDFTLLTTIGKINGSYPPGSTIMCRPEDCPIKYHPMVVGRDAILQTFAYRL